MSGLLPFLRLEYNIALTSVPVNLIYVSFVPGDKET